MHNKILLALIIVIVILLLLRRVASAPKTVSRSATILVDQSVKPSHMPIYKTGVDDYGNILQIADFTSVPIDKKPDLVAMEPKDITIIDKRVIEGDTIQNTQNTQNIQLMQRSDVSIINDIMQQQNMQIAIQQAMMIDMTQINQINEAQKTFIQSIPVSNSCIDTETDCVKWARNNDCLINPKIMFEKCPNACRVCGMNSSQKKILINLYEKRDPINCVTHGGYSI